MLLHLINYCRCSLQYVVKTVQKLNERFNLHKTSFMHPPQHGNCKIFCEQFTKGIYKSAKDRVQIIGKMEGNGRTKRVSMDHFFSQKRKAKETEWIKTLQTVYSNGPTNKDDSKF